MTTHPLFDLDLDQQQVRPVATSSGRFSRAGGVYGVHAYHTKIPPNAIEPEILRHTKPGDLVLDPFCGSGMTGVAARRLGRDAWLSDLSPAAVHIARNYTLPCDPELFDRAVGRVLAACEEARRELYETHCHSCGNRATTAYVVWSDVRSCPSCEWPIRIWDQRHRDLRRLECPSCRATFAKAESPITGEVSALVNIMCQACGRLQREPSASDTNESWLTVLAPDWYPQVNFDSSREMWRRGHEDLGIRSVADFYSARNLRALSRLWAAIGSEESDRLRDALRFSFTAIVNRASKRYQWNAKRPTNVLGGTLYVSSLRYEFNVFDLWKRKVSAARKLFEATRANPGSATVTLSSATRLPLPDESAAYCYTDPPFGANIVYSDCSLLWEAWLGDLMDVTAEAIVTRHRDPADGGKDVDAYGLVMTAAFAEIARVLRSGASASVVFQNTDDRVWSAIQLAISHAGLGIEQATTLHKSQPSFKGVKATQRGERVAATDVVLTLRRGKHVTTVHPGATWVPIAAAIDGELRSSSLANRLRSTGHLYAVALAAALENGIPSNQVTYERLETWLQANYHFAAGWLPKEHASVP